MARCAWLLLCLTACVNADAALRELHRAKFGAIALREDARPTDASAFEDFRTDPDAGVRARCAIALGRLPFAESSAEVTRALLQSLTDADAQVRAAAAFALGMRGDPSSADKLVFTALDYHQADPDGLVRARAVEALTKLDRPELRERLLDALLDPDPRVRLEAAQGASRWPATDPNASAIDERLLAALERETDARVITYTLFALERRKSTAAFGAFVRHSSSADVEQRLFAVRGLKALSVQQSALGHLWRATTDADWRIACEGVLGLSGASDEGSMSHIAALTRHSNANVRRSAFEAAGAAAERDAENYRRLQRTGCELTAALGSSAHAPEPSSWVRGAMCEAHLRSLKHFGAPGGALDSTLTLLARGTAQLSREEHVGVARGLAVLDAGRAVPVLLEMARSSDVVVAGTALESLAKFPSANVRRALHDALASNDNGLRLAAVLALAEMPDASDMEPLARCSTSSTGDGAPEIRFNTLRSASKIGGAAAVDVFMKGLLDGNAFVRHVAREELARIDPEAAQRAARLDLGSPSFALDAAEFERDLTELANELTEHDLLEPAATPMVDVVTTKGTLRFELFPGEAPLHVLNFLVLAQRDHYDGAPWHRVVPDFVIQGGDYRGDGNGGGTWRGPDQALRHEITPRKYVRGSLGMPRNEDIDSGGSQIFVTHRPTPHLDGRYTIFGELRAGFDVLDTIEVGDRILDVKRVR